MSRYTGGIIRKEGLVPTLSSASGIWTLSDQARFVKAGTWPGLGLYLFSSFTFTPAGITGINGPTRANCLASYNTTANPWLNDTAFFNVVTQGYQLWTVPRTGTYSIDAYGAIGGVAGSGTVAPGNGARIKGNFALTAGTKLRIVVGQSGGYATGIYGGSGGGGGGTFVMKETGTTNADIYVIAGGGGGASYYGSSVAGGAGSDVSGSGAGGLAGSGTGGNGGASILNNGSSSGYGAGGNSYSTTAIGGTSYDGTNGRGGFGGGGGNGFSGGGGGGGQTGGKGGDNGGSSAAIGGNSYNNGTSQTNTAGANNAAGQVIITLL